MFVCPFCGEMVQESKKVCPHCGMEKDAEWDPSFDSTEPFDIHGEDAESRSDGLFNRRKHPAAAVGFIVILLIVVALFVYRYIL